MLPAARALPPRLPPAWRWAGPAVLGTGVLGTGVLGTGPLGTAVLGTGVRALGSGRPRRAEALAGAPLAGESLAGEALARAPLDTAAKEYSPKVRQLVRDIAGLTLLEVADLNALLKETLKIPDVAVMPAAASLPSQAAPQEEEEAVPLKKEKTHFTVRLTEMNAADKVKLIKEVKNFVPGVNLVQAKKLVESLPQEIKANASKEEAEKIKAALEAAGGTVVLE